MTRHAITLAILVGFAIAQAPATARAWPAQEKLQKARQRVSQWLGRGRTAQEQISHGTELLDKANKARVARKGLTGDRIRYLFDKITASLRKISTEQLAERKAKLDERGSHPNLLKQVRLKLRGNYHKSVGKTRAFANKVSNNLLDLAYGLRGVMEDGRLMRQQAQRPALEPRLLNLQEPLGYTTEKQGDGEQRRVKALAAQIAADKAGMVFGLALGKPDGDKTRAFEGIVTDGTGENPRFVSGQRLKGGEYRIDTTAEVFFQQPEIP